MVKKNPGKLFEEDIKRSVPEDCFIYRFKDGTANFSGSKNENVRFQAKNICDFMIMTIENLILLELKSHAGIRISFDCIRENQIKQMSEIDHPKIKTYFLFNFRDMEKTYAIEAKKIKEYMETSDRKSFPLTWCEENGIEVLGTKNRTRWRYDLKGFFEEVEGSYE
jgi:recombination protein U